MKEAKITDKKGFTLLEILLVLGIMGVIAVFTIGIAHSIRNMTKVNETKSRMEQIVAKAKEYYRGHEELPPGASVLQVGGRDVGVPVGTSEFNLEQKYRLDSWGRYMYYNRVENQSAITIDNITFAADSLTDIDGLIVDGRNVAGVIISYGPNQTLDTTISGPNAPNYAPVTYTTGGDDIVIPIDVSQEAMEVALENLKVLQSKVKAFDAIYEGINNDADADVDEDDNGPGVPPDQCFREALDDPSPKCPPNNSTNDPNCGTATLDHIEDGYYISSCPANFGQNARDFICDFYNLADKYRIDPWLNGYIWGADSNPENSYDGTPPTYQYPSSDPRYHKFFSMGPDGTAGNGDDIIP